MSAAHAHALAVEPLLSSTCYGLADCNNFYAACETVFQPKLAGKPVIVLSNNDGCVIARSQAAKALGVTMGQPAHELSALITRQDLIVCSANFALYGDMSARVMEVLSRSAPRLDVYSIDEAFLDLTVVPPSRRAGYAARLRAQVKQWTGIPVSIGIAPTKTLAKAVNDRAKKLPAGILELGSHTPSRHTVGEWLLENGSRLPWRARRLAGRQTTAVGCAMVCGACKGKVAC